MTQENKRSNKKKDTKHRAVLITRNNPPDDWEKAFEDSRISFYIYQFEKGNETETLHIQAYVEFNGQVHFSTLKNMFEGARIDPRRGTAEQAITYCSKEETRVRGPFTSGVPRVKAAKLKLMDLLKMIEDGKTVLDCHEIAPAETILNKKHMLEHSQLLNERKTKKHLEETFKEASLRNWQEEAIEKLLKQDSRKVLWVVDEKGNTGKTWLSKWLFFQFNAMILNNGKTADIAHAYDNQDIVVFDFSRSQEGHINYGVIENLKNGCIFSGKYGSRQKIFVEPKIIVFSNFEPDMTKFSADRWDIMRLRQEMEEENKPAETNERRDEFVEHWKLAKQANEERIPLSTLIERRNEEERLKNNNSNNENTIQLI